MRNFIAAVSLAALAQGLAYADESYEPGQVEQQVSAPEENESVESAEAGESAAAGESQSAEEEETDSQAPRELDV